MTGRLTVKMVMLRKKVAAMKTAKKLRGSQVVERETTQKLIFPFVEIEIPADVPPASDPHAVHDYFMAHPEVADRIVREYDAAYRKWLRSQNKKEVQAKSQFRQAGSRDRKVSARPPS
jgi:hypothetical protein